MRERPWVRQAACLGLDANIFHPLRGAPTEPARRVCATCPVRAECLQWAIEQHEQHGIWGGTTEKERRAIRARLRRQGAADRLRSPVHVAADERAVEARRLHRSGMPVIDIAVRLNVTRRAVHRYLEEAAA